MHFRPVKALIALLLLAMAGPPPLMAVRLIDGGRTKTLLACGRNRLPSPPAPEVEAVEARLGSGRGGKIRRSSLLVGWPMIGFARISPRLISLASPSRIGVAIRLRC